MPKFLTVLAFLASTAFADPTAIGPGFVERTPASIAWHEIPNSHGLRMATLVGDPSRPGFYVIRIRFPPYVMSAPHFHPNARYVTVLEGTWYAGTGETFAPEKAVPLPAGSFMLHPPRAAHWDGARGAEPVVVQIVGEGPAESIPVVAGADGMIELPH